MAESGEVKRTNRVIVLRSGKRLESVLDLLHCAWGQVRIAHFTRGVVEVETVSEWQIESDMIEGKE